ncbi:hypothetical protein [Mycolicibacter arupensis]|nr:hypothetical protein [Mycolicibacter arupensis]
MRLQNAYWYWRVRVRGAVAMDPVMLEMDDNDELLGKAITGIGSC